MMYFKVMVIFHASPHWEELFKFFSWPLVWHFLPQLFQKLSSSWETGLNMGGLLRMKECKYFGSGRNVLIRISYFQEAHRSLWPYHIRVSHLFFERFSSSRPRESWRNGCFSPQSWAWSRVRGFNKTFYSQGTGCEMYTEILSPSFVGMTFNQASVLCFTKLKLLLLAIETKSDIGKKTKYSYFIKVKYISFSCWVIYESVNFHKRSIKILIKLIFFSKGNKNHDKSTRC